MRRSRDPGRAGLIPRQAVAPVVILALVAACAVAAGLLGRPVWAALVGAGLVLLYWGIEALTWRRARDRRDLALGLAVGGMFVRLAVAMIVLVVIGIVDRPAFATAALAFVATFTVYMMVRPLIYSQATGPAGQAGLQ